MAVMKGVAHKWRVVGDELSISRAILSFIDGDCVSDEERLRRVVRYWILKDPYASWRQLITSLYGYGHNDADLIKVAGDIKSNAEKLTGT